MLAPITISVGGRRSRRYRCATVEMETSLRMPYRMSSEEIYHFATHLSLTQAHSVGHDRRVPPDARACW
jgi:hypothetical protein